ncbi:hypothetical protein BOTCAL_0138g00250 [Botryotinia calthae]|uniref:Uncharacterized protein n=1 Tax=Botryotinia calthae TaxID=38488 RepID=A0A4Y8D5N0_9HELO|nr:hypothetical protein BOTCAL_0138g00250 [Botryotinia calthae]
MATAYSQFKTTEIHYMFAFPVIEILSGLTGNDPSRIFDALKFEGTAPWEEMSPETIQNLIATPRELTGSFLFAM